MNTKTIKVTIFVIVSVLFVSMIFPAGTGNDNGYGKSLETPPGFEKYQGSIESSYHPILAVEEPKMFFVIEDEEGNNILVDMPKDIDEKEIENRIIQRIKEESYQDEIIGKNENKNIQEKEPEENKTEELKEKSREEESTKVVILTSYLLDGYLDGYLFCDINETLHFDASSIRSSYNVVKYEWDYDGDGFYEQVSLSPILSHKYTSKGLYDLRIRITYSYNYTYYPLDTGHINEISYRVQVRNISNTEDTTGFVLFNEDNLLNKGNDVETEYIAPEIIEIEESIDYEIIVSVVSKENGYPPILDFEISCEIEDCEPKGNDDISVGQINLPLQTTINQPDLFYTIEPIIVNPGTRASVTPQNIIKRNETDDSLKIPTIHVKVKDVKDVSENEKQGVVYIFEDYKGQEISYLENCKVEFDASKTIDKNERTIFSWDFGDGEFGEGIKVSHTYAHRGTYTATLHAKGWDHSISKTFTVLRGSEDPKQIYITNNYAYPLESYLFCNLNEPMIFDIFEIVNRIDLSWVEWDFDADGIYEENVTSSWITKKFLEPGYFEVNFRYTYSYESSAFIFLDNVSPSMERNYYQKSVISYYNNTYSIMVVVRDEDNSYPLIPDFITKAPQDFLWWNQQEFSGGLFDVTEQKNITYLKYHSPGGNRLNSWKNPVTFSANSTIIPKGTSYDDFLYFWDFGDGDTAKGFEVSHEFEDPQNDYQVKLTVWNDKYNVFVTKTVAPRPYSPNIYLYRETPGFDTIKVIVDGRVTKAVPMVELGDEIVWKDVFIDSGKLNYNGDYYDFLYYEELLNEPRTSEYGWNLERDEAGNLFLDGKLLSLGEIKDFFREELRKAGLFENEIEDFIDEWFGEGARLFPGQKPFHYAIMYIPEKIMDEIIQIETEKGYDEIIRVHFLIQPVNKDIQLAPPQYLKHKEGRNILHEWGVYFGNSISVEGKNNNNSWFNDLIGSYHDLQIYMTYENRIGRHILIPESGK